MMKRTQEIESNENEKRRKNQDVKLIWEGESDKRLA